MKLMRTKESWAQCVPEVVASKSNDSAFLTLQAAQHDIAELHAEVESLRSQLSREQEHLARFNEESA